MNNREMVETMGEVEFQHKCAILQAAAVLRVHETSKQAVKIALALWDEIEKQYEGE